MIDELPDFSLNLEQQFDIQKYREFVKKMPRETLEELFLQAMYTEMMQKNLIKGLVERSLRQSMGEEFEMPAAPNQTGLDE
ncbi:MAG: photosystem I reaction center subunit XII [Cyanobacteria bacterium P01_D01_bin.44]